MSITFSVDAKNDIFDFVYYQINSECLHLCNGKNIVFSFDEKWIIPFALPSPHRTEHFIIYLMEIVLPLYS
jgi:hypothetical protein